MNTSALIAAARFHSLAACAAAYGGFWCPPLAEPPMWSRAKSPVPRASRLRKRTTPRHYRARTWGDDWYGAIAAAQPFGYGVIPFDDEREEWYCRWDARTIARAACRPVRVVP